MISKKTAPVTQTVPPSAIFVFDFWKKWKRSTGTSLLPVFLGFKYYVRQQHGGCRSTVFSCEIIAFIFQLHPEKQTIYHDSIQVKFKKCFKMAEVLFTAKKELTLGICCGYYRGTMRRCCILCCKLRWFNRSK